MLTGMTNEEHSEVATEAVDLVVPLLKASLDPASKRATRPIDSPAGQIVSQVARRDLDTGGADGILHLATGVASTLSYLVPALAEELGHDPDRAAGALAAALRTRDGNPYMVRILEQIATPACIEVIGEAMEGENGEVFDLILHLADCAATHTHAYAHVTSTPIDDVWAEIQTGLRE
jgi:hypothetical protein